MRLLVTGAAGFIGAHACRTALSRGDQVLALDNFYTGSQANLDWAASVGGDLRFLKHDVRQPLPALEADAVLHLACPASPPHYQRDPVYTLETAFLGTRQVLDWALGHKVPVVIASTSEVYGDPEEHPQTESYWGRVNCIGIRSCYDEGKRAAETLAADLRRSRGLDVRIVRIFNTYGPRMAFDDGRVVSNFLVQALRDEPLTVYGEGSQTRSFCYVDDLVDGLFRALDRKQPLDGPVNLGNPDERSILELLEAVQQHLGRPLKMVHKALPQDDPVRRCPDISRARALLGWEPRVPLAEGIARTVEAFAARLEAGELR